MEGRATARSGSVCHRLRAERARATLILSFLLLVATIPAAHARIGEVVLSGGLDPDLRARIETRLTTAVNAIDAGELEPVRQFCTESGWEELDALTSSLRLYNPRPVHETKLLEVRDGYEVREIKLQIDANDIGETVANPNKYMAFSLTRDGLIRGVRFEMEKHHVDRMLDEAVDVEDYANRQEILQFVEVYRTAYNRKDLAFIEKVFSDDALIIVGRVIRRDPSLPTQSDQLASSSLSEDNIQLIRSSKSEYIAGLRRVFAKNEYVDVRFDSVELVRPNSDPDIYGVTLKQEWRSSTYADTGYVFLMIDFRDENRPLIHVRAWQPDRFSDGTTITVYDFKLIR